MGPTGKRFILDNPELRYTVIRRVLERIAHDRPLLIWTDDLHYASQNTFDVLSRIQRGSTVRCLLVATAREEALEADPVAARRMQRLADEWGADVMRLHPLADEETHVLLRATLPLHQDAIRAATRQSRGNPLFALQLVHAWAGGGYLRMEAGRYRVPVEALAGRAITTAELWDERLRGLDDSLRGIAYAAAALGDDVRGVVLKALAQSLGMDPRESLSALTRAQILLATGVDQYRWAHALLQEHLLARLHEREDGKKVFRAAADALALHPMIGSRRVMKHRVLNLARAGEDEMAGRLMLKFIEGAWSRGRDTTATLKDLKLVEGRVTGLLAAEHAYWMAEALRHTGKLEEAKVHGRRALAMFREFADVKHEAHCLRLLGHIASDLGQPMRGREMVAEAIRLSTSQGDARGRARAMVVIGEIDVLLGEHVRASKVLEEAERACAEAGDELARGQGLILNAMIAMGRGRFEGATHLLVDARVAFDAIGYRLGIAQCETVLAHADHRGRRFAEARARAQGARVAFQELTNPRGEAACERLLAFVAFDEDDFATAALHASISERIYDRLADPWGLLESRLLLAQVALARGDLAEAVELSTACAYIHTDEAEPRQHRHLTQAWLAREQGRWADAADAIEAARDTYPDPARCGDHTPFLVERLRSFDWQGTAAALVEAWASALNDSLPESTM